MLISDSERVPKHPPCDAAKCPKDVLVLTTEFRLRIGVAELMQHCEVLTVGQPHLTESTQFWLLGYRVERPIVNAEMFEQVFSEGRTQNGHIVADTTVRNSLDTRFRTDRTPPDAPRARFAGHTYEGDDHRLVQRSDGVVDRVIPR
jgi:hypothetical protein